MVIIVISCPKLVDIDQTLRAGLLFLYLKVDDTFAADGYYHVPAQDLVVALRKEGHWKTARLWEELINQKNWSHVAIPADYCRLVVRNEPIEVEL